MDNKISFDIFKWAYSGYHRTCPTNFNSLDSLVVKNDYMLYKGFGLVPFYVKEYLKIENINIH